MLLSVGTAIATRLGFFFLTGSDRGTDLAWWCLKSSCMGLLRRTYSRRRMLMSVYTSVRMSRPSS